MKPVTLFLIVGVGVLATGRGTDVLAAEDSKDITRVAIAVSGGSVAYTDQFRQNPPAIVIEFRSRNVRAQFEPLVAVHSGIIKEIQSDYYPPGRRALKSLTLTLAQPAVYSIAQLANQILIDIETPSGLLPGRMAIGGGLTILGIEAKETLISRLKAMGDALQQTAPPEAVVPVVKSKPVVVTKPAQIPHPVVQPSALTQGVKAKPAPMPISGKGVGEFWYGVLFGIGASCVAVVGWRRRRRATLTQEKRSTIPGESPPIAQGASVLEQLVLKAVQRQGYRVIASKAVADLGTLWSVQKDDARSGLVCLSDGGFFERKVLEQFVDALQQEALRSGTVYALGAFTAPAQAFAKENQIHLISREEVVRLMEVELKGPVLTTDAEKLSQQLVKSQSDLDQAQAKIQALGQELSAQKKKWEEAEWYLGEERTKKQALEQQVAELTQKLAAKDELHAKLAQEAGQLKAKSAEVDQRLAAEQEKRTQLETQIAQLIQESTEAAKDTIKAVAAGESKATQEVLQGQEHRKWPRLDLSRHNGKGVLIRATSNDGEPINGDARNLSAGGLCVELPSGEALADEFELKLFLPDRTKPIEAIGKLIWRGRGSRRLPAPRSSRQAGRMEQLGVAFSAVNAPDQEAISQFVDERTPHQFAGAS